MGGGKLGKHGGEDKKEKEGEITAGACLLSHLCLFGQVLCSSKQRASPCGVTFRATDI